jgi:flagellar M-ring protein FliF
MAIQDWIFFLTMSALALVVVMVLYVAVVMPVLAHKPEPKVVTVFGDKLYVEALAALAAKGMEVVEDDSMDVFRERLKQSSAPKKSTISADMLDMAGSYDDKVALVRMLVTEDSNRVALAMKKMIQG